MSDPEEFGALEIRRDFVEVSMDLARLVSAFGPDMLMHVPRRFRGAPNQLGVRDLLSARAADLPGFVAELQVPDRLRRVAFRVDGAAEAAFLEGLRKLVNELLLEARHAVLRPGVRGGPGAGRDPAGS
jgi:hypothetical protein